MKRIIIFCIIILFFGLGFVYKNELFFLSRNITNYSPCNIPKTYKIGTIDPRFYISNDKLRKDLEESIKIWSDAIGKPLFIYDPKAKLTINFTYDTRQELNSAINQLDSNIQQKKNELDPRIEDYKKKSADFSSRLKAFNAEIEKWNKQGGATEEVYNKLIEEQGSLKQEAANLNSTAKELGQSTDQYNAQVSNLNSTISSFDLAIQGRPEEGLYERDSKGETITIYLYNSQTELIHTLAHEFGHSLGLNHVLNKDAIMFAKTNSAITPSKGDLEQLYAICRERFIGEAAFDYYRELLKTIASRFEKTN